MEGHANYNVDSAPVQSFSWLPISSVRLPCPASWKRSMSGLGGADIGRPGASVLPSEAGAGTQSARLDHTNLKICKGQSGTRNRLRNGANLGLFGPSSVQDHPRMDCPLGCPFHPCPGPIAGGVRAPSSKVVAQTGRTPQRFGQTGMPHPKLWTGAAAVMRQIPSRGNRGSESPGRAGMLTATRGPGMIAAIQEVPMSPTDHGMAKLRWKIRLLQLAVASAACVCALTAWGHGGIYRWLRRGAATAGDGAHPLGSGRLVACKTACEPVES